MIQKKILTGLVAGAMLAGAVGASAATLSGTFNVIAVNASGLNSAESEATPAALSNLFLAPGFNGSDEFVYTGALDFGTFGANTTTISDWLASGPGSVTGLDATFGGLTLSSPNINTGTATSTFFAFVLDGLDPVTRFVVNHDDGVGIFDDGVFRGGFANPTTVRETIVTGFDGGQFQAIYVATNGNPSVLNVAAVPLPAGGLLLIGALGGLAALRRRKKAA